MPDNPKGPSAKGAAASADDKAKGPIGMEELAERLTGFTSAITKEVQGIRQLVNQRDEQVRVTLEELAARAQGGRAADPDEDEDDETLERFDELAGGGKRRRHPLLRHVEKVRQEAEARDDVILQGQAVTLFLVESDPGDPTKGIPPENRKKYLPKIEEILRDRAGAARFVHRDAQGRPDYKTTLENVYQHLQLGELREAQAKGAEEKRKLDRERAAVTGAAFISGDSAVEEEAPADTAGLSSDEMLAAGLVPLDQKNPPQPLYEKE